MSVLNNIFKKIEDKTELASHEVYLSLADDLKITSNSLKDQIFIDDEVYSKSIKISSDLELLRKKAQERFTSNEQIVQSSFKKIQLAEKYIAQAERVSKELGIDVKTLPNYNDVIDAKNKAQDNIKRLSSIQNKLK